MADFGFAGNVAVVDAVLASEPTAAAITESDVEDGVETSTSAEEGFCKAGNFDVVRYLILACVIETKAKGWPIHPATKKTRPNKKNRRETNPDGLYLSSQQTQTNDYLIRRVSPGFSSSSYFSMYAKPSSPISKKPAAGISLISRSRMAIA